MDQKLVEIKDLSVAFFQEGRLTPVVREVSLDIYNGETLALVGESGSGKSITAKSIMQLIPDPPGKIIGGEIRFSGADVLRMKERELREIRGKKVAMIFQEPMSSLNPLFTCGDQIMEVVQRHNRVRKKEARARAIEMLELVGVPSPEKRIASYPHELSGGMRQRIMIAMALSCSPELLIADEPTTALDPTIQAQILKLIKDLQEKLHMSVLLITHDLGIVAENCSRVAVMYAGQIVEIAEIKELFANPLHPYTKGLLHAIPRLDTKVERLYNIDGMVPRFNELPPGCAFAPRCPYRRDCCREDGMELIEKSKRHAVRCIRSDQVAAEQEIMR